MIGVKNNLEETVESRYDGQDYQFKPGVTVALADEAATHIFGYGLDDKSRALIRLGWLANSTAMKDALEKLDNIQFFAEAKVVFDEPAVSDIKGTKLAAGGGKMEIPAFTADKK